MTALMSLRSRLALARLAVRLTGPEVDPASAEPLIRAGVDLLVLAAGGSDDEDCARLESFREAYGVSRLLLAVDNPAIASRVAADVVHVERPGWRLWGDYPRGHSWTLLGRGVQDARTVRRPGDVWDFMFVGPLPSADPGSRALAEALRAQAPFTDGALPWFALGDWDAADAQRLTAAGVRRVALPLTGVDESGIRRVGEVAAVLAAAWDGDEDADRYRMASLLL